MAEKRNIHRGGQSSSLAFEYCYGGQLSPSQRKSVTSLLTTMLQRTGGTIVEKGSSAGDQPLRRDSQPHQASTSANSSGA